MACYHPVRLHRHGHLAQDVPCGGCLGCRLEYSRQWAIRCMHEASQHDNNCFITLTYDDYNIPPLGTLVKRHFQLFLKRLRKAIAPTKISYYHCGEYGERYKRPHYHALLFGWDFPDKTLYTTRGEHNVYTSDTLNTLWPNGRSEIGHVTFDSAAYVARYVAKKAQDADYIAPHARIDLETGELIELAPEYATMSRRPAIGKDWFEKYGEEVYQGDGVISRGKLVKPPRYYDTQYELAEPSIFETVRQQRAAKRRYGENLAAAEKIARSKFNLLTRGLE